MIDIILGSSANALAIVRSLKKEASSIFIIHHDKYPFATYSKYVDSSFKVDDYTQTLTVLEQLSKQGPAVLYATSDYWSQFIAQYQDELRSHGVIFPIIESAFIARVLDKQSFYDYYHHDFYMPETVAVEELLDAASIVKPRMPFDGNRVIEKGFKTSFDHKEERCLFVRQRQLSLSLTDHISVAGIASQGKILSYVLSHKVSEYPSPGGTATVIENAGEKIESEVLKNANKFIHNCQYSGAFEIEFIRDGGELWLLEFNPRFWLQHNVLDHVGRSMALLYRKVLLSNKPAKDLFDDELDISPHFLWVHEGMIKSILHQPFSTTLHIVKSLFSPSINKSFAYFDVKDVTPFLEFIKCHLIRKR